jgi:thymidine kinase
LGLAEELIEIKTICDCGRKATMNMRIDADGKAQTCGEQVQIGGNQTYTSKCMKCFKKNIPSFRSDNILTNK